MNHERWDYGVGMGFRVVREFRRQNKDCKVIDSAGNVMGEYDDWTEAVNAGRQFAWAKFDHDYPIQPLSQMRKA